MTKYSVHPGDIALFFCPCYWLVLICQHYVYKAQELYDRRPLKVKKRKRALSLSLNDKERKIQGQKESLFFKLPAELRGLVYNAYIGQEISVEWSQRKEKKAVRVFGVRPLEGEEDVNALEETRGERVDILPLLQTCRRIYSEMIPLVYATPSFTIISHFSFLPFASSLLPQRLCSIARLRLDLGREEVYARSLSRTHKLSLFDSYPSPQPNGSFSRHPLNETVSSKFIRNLTHKNPEVSKFLNPKHSHRYLEVVWKILSQMDGLRDLRIMIWTIHLGSWANCMLERVIHPDEILSRISERGKSPILQIAEVGRAGYETARIGFKWQLEGALRPEYDWVLFEGEADFQQSIQPATILIL